MQLTVGELAKRTGLTVRTLHHYDEAGLLSASARSAAGYRLYTESDIERLNRIQLYKQMGLPLKQILVLLGKDGLPFVELLERQVDMLTKHIAQQSRVLMRLERLVERARAEGNCEPEELLQLMSVMSATDKYFDESELAQFDKRRLAMGSDRLKSLGEAWRTLLEEINTAMKNGVPSTAPATLAMARRWLELTREFTGDNPALLQKMSVMYQKEERLQKETGITPEVQNYIYPAIMQIKDYIRPALSGLEADKNENDVKETLE